MYLAGVEHARTVVWIAETIKEDHRAAIDWLNLNTVKEFSFFAIQIELARIGNSPPAPRWSVRINNRCKKRAVAQLCPYGMKRFEGTKPLYFRFQTPEIRIEYQPLKVLFRHGSVATGVFFRWRGGKLFGTSLGDLESEVTQSRGNGMFAARKLLGCERLGARMQKAVSNPRNRFGIVAPAVVLKEVLARFAKPIASEKCRSAQLVKMPDGLIHSGPRQLGQSHVLPCSTHENCDQPAFDD
jgi:hypothetical protein